MNGRELPPSLGGPDPRARSAFGRIRRRIGIGLVVVAAIVTIWSLSQPSGAPVGEGAAATDSPSAAATDSPGAPTTASPGAAAATDGVCGTGTPAGATPVTLPREHADAWTSLVGAIVCFPHELIVSEVYELGRRGTMSLADRRLYAPGTGLEIAGDDLHLVRIAPEASPEGGWPLPWGLDVGGIRVGDAVHGVAGTLERDGVGGYVIVTLTAPAFEVRNPRPADPPAVGGDLRVAAFNLGNFFTTLGSRGARDAEELRRQTLKLAAALAALDADVLALIEVENDDGHAVGVLARALGDALDADGEERRYAPAPAPRVRGGDAIRQAFLYDPVRLEVVSVDADGDAVHNRPPQAATFRPVGGGAPFTVIAVHHRSKGSCPTAGDVDAGFGCWNLRRSAQSDALLRFADRLVAGTGSADVLVIGDLNAHRFEPPVALFEARGAEGAAGWEVLTDRVDAKEAYSYVYFGRSAALDHAIATAALAERVEGVAYWPINADEPPIADYRTRPGAPAAFRVDPFRSSDHDPVVVGLWSAPPDTAPRGVPREVVR